MDEIVDPDPPLHTNCRCDIITMESILAGNAIKNGVDGSESWLKHFGGLPEYDIRKEELISLCWNERKRPSKFASEKLYRKTKILIFRKLQEEYGIWINFCSI